jgi:hypothetical protein
VYQFSTGLNDFGSELSGWNKAAFNLSNVSHQVNQQQDALPIFATTLQTNDIAIVGLLPGKLLKVTVLPTDTGNVESKVPFTNKAVKTTCGCPHDSNTLRTTESTGSPISVSLLQVIACLYATVYSLVEILVSWTETRQGVPVLDRHVLV